MGKKFKIDMKTAGITALACATLWAGATYLPQVMDLMQPAKIPITSPISEEKGKIYAVITNGSTNPIERYNRKNAINSMLDALSAYKFAKGKGISDENISFFLYNPANINLFETEEYKSLLEKKAFSGILPTKEDIKGIDGIATKNKFLEAIKNIPSNSKDSIYIFYSIPAPTKMEPGIENSHRENKTKYMNMGEESIVSDDIKDSIEKKSYNKIIIVQDSKWENVVSRLNPTNPLNPSPNLKNVLAITSPLEKENGTFLFSLLEELSKDKNQSIESLTTELGAEVYYFDDGEKSPEESPDFYKPFMN